VEIKMKKYILLFMINLTIGCTPSLTQKEIDNADYGIYPENYEELIKGYLFSIATYPDSIKYEYIKKPRKQVFGGRLRDYSFGYLVCLRFDIKGKDGKYRGFKTESIRIKNNQIIEVSATNRYNINLCVYGNPKTNAPTPESPHPAPPASVDTSGYQAIY
jgi:hypothetical protein